MTEQQTPEPGSSFDAFVAEIRLAMDERDRACRAAAARDRRERGLPKAAVIGDCTCDHDEEQHGDDHCDVDGCPCEAGWEK